MNFCTWFPLLIFFTASAMGFLFHYLWNRGFFGGTNKNQNLLDGIRGKYENTSKELANSSLELSQIKEKNKKLENDFYGLTLAFKKANDDLSKIKNKQSDFDNVISLSEDDEKEISKLHRENEELVEQIKVWKKRSEGKKIPINKKAKYFKKKLKKKKRKLNDALERLESIELLQQKVAGLQKDLTALKLDSKEEIQNFPLPPEAKIKTSDNLKSSKIIEELSTFSIEDELQDSSEDLKLLYGINEAVEDVLNESGIFDFSDLSTTKIETLKNILREAGDAFADVNPVNWPLQARIAEKGYWDVLKEYRMKMENLDSKT